MKYTLTLFFLLALLLVDIPVLAQKGVKIYTARVNSDQKKGPITKRDRDEITFQAKDKIANLETLLGLLSSTDITESERNSVIRNSYLPNQNQLFYNDAIIIEDDIDPKHVNADNTADLKVERYLRDLDLFYTKSANPTIKFSQIVSSAVVEGKEYPYIKVFFTSVFTGKHNQFNTPYKPLQRVAELRADKVDGKWRTFIIRLGFLRPGEGLTVLSAPVITQDFRAKPHIRGNELLFKSTENTDSVTVRWDKRWLNVIQSSTQALPLGFFQRSSEGAVSQEKISIMLTNDDQRLTFRRIDGTVLTFLQTSLSTDEERERLKHKYKTLGWLQIVTGTFALGAGYAGYHSLQQSHSDYINRLSALNNEYAIWQTLSQQPAGSPATPMTFTNYAQPGIYAVYGSGIIGSGLLINGIRHLLKAGKI
ncbi:hypothetical protein GCM10027592_17520 [Spirosoma flavus]